jgi:hypothetical protein
MGDDYTLPDLSFLDGPSAVQRIRLEPGDVLALKVNFELSLDELAVIKEQFDSAFPDHRTVVLTDCDLTIVSPPAAEG